MPRDARLPLATAVLCVVGVTVAGCAMPGARPAAITAAGAEVPVLAGEANRIPACIAQAEEALSLSRAMGWRSAEALALCVLGQALSAGGEYGRALDAIQLGLTISTEIEHHQWLINSHLNLGALYADLSTSSVGLIRRIEAAARERGVAVLDAPVSGGRAGWQVAGMTVLELTTIGRKSGQPRTVLLTSPLREGDAYVIVASRGGDDQHPAWFLNLRDNPDVQVTLKGEAAKPMVASVADADLHALGDGLHAVQLEADRVVARRDSAEAVPAAFAGDGAASALHLGR